jgi:uncharacterized membrane protein YfcA
MELQLSGYLLAIAAAVLVGLSKTGVPGVALLAILLMAQAFAGRETLSVGAILPVLLVGDVLAVTFYRRHAQWGKLVGLLPAVLAGMVPAVVLLGRLDDAYFKLILGTMILGLLGLELGRKWLRLGTARHHWGFTLVMGLLAGFGTVLGNAAGPVMTIYLVGRGLDKQEFMGTWAWFFLIVNTLKVPIYGDLNMITAETLRLDLLLLPAVLGGALVGPRLFRVIPQRLFDALVLLLAAAAGVHLIVG